MDHAFLFQVLYSGDQVNSHSDKGVQIKNNPVTFEILLQSRVCRKVVTQQTMNWRNRGEKKKKKKNGVLKTFWLTHIFLEAGYFRRHTQQTVISLRLLVSSYVNEP